MWPWPYPDSLFGRVNFLQSQLSGNKVRTGRSSKKMSSNSSSSSTAGSPGGDVGRASCLSLVCLPWPSTLLNGVLSPHPPWACPKALHAPGGAGTPKPLTCSQKKLLLPDLLRQGRRQTAAAQESGDAGWPIADVLGPFLTRQPHGALPEPSLTAFALQLCLELVHCGPEWGGLSRTWGSWDASASMPCTPGLYSAVS